MCGFYIVVYDPFFHGANEQSFAQAFSKACRVKGQRPLWGFGGEASDNSVLRS